MKKRFISWWSKQTPDNKQLFITTALVVGCGFLFYKAGFVEGQRQIIAGFVKGVQSV